MPRQQVSIHELPSRPRRHHLGSAFESHTSADGKAILATDSSAVVRERLADRGKEPVTDQRITQAAITIAGPASRLTPDRLESRYADLLADRVNELELGLRSDG